MRLPFAELWTIMQKVTKMQSGIGKKRIEIEAKPIQNKFRNNFKIFYLFNKILSSFLFTPFFLYFTFLSSPGLFSQDELIRKVHQSSQKLVDIQTLLFVRARYMKSHER